MLMRVIVDQDKCVGSGQCVLAAPSVFDQRDEDGIVILLDPEPPQELDQDVRRSAMVCPALAIQITD
jgi:ferredoxin